MELTEYDLAAVGRIEELKSTTHARAKEIFRKQVAKLANPDVEGRAQLVLEAIGRGAEVASDEEVEETVTKKAKQKKAKKPSTRVEFPRAELTREIELTPVPESHLYTANLFGKKHAVVLQEVNRTLGAHQRFQAVTMSNTRMEAVKKFAKDEDLPIAYCVRVRVLGKIDQGYAVPVKLFDEFKHKQGPNFGFSLSNAARKAYSENGWDGVRFTEKKVNEKAA